MRNAFFVFSIMLAMPIALFSQTIETFSNIDESFAETGLFWNKASNTFDPPSTVEYSYPNSKVTREHLYVNDFNPLILLGTSSNWRFSFLIYELQLVLSEDLQLKKN